MRAKYLFCFLLLPLSLLSQSTISIHKIDTNICTEDSEVNFLQVNDTAAYFTRIHNNQNNYTTKVYKSTFTNGKWGHSKPSKLNHYINNPSNIFFTEDRIYVCGFLEDYKKPSIFYSEIKDSSQYNFIKVFNNNFFNSQPIVVSTKNYKVMYFVSDMPGGFGGLDIWLTIIDHDGNFGAPINAGKQINTKYDEVTPYYQTKNNQLYFSSNKSKGLGGFDIYSSQGSLNKWKSPVNVKQLNSIFDELYFNYYNDTVGYFSSNRKTEDTEGDCCSDIYIFNDTAQKPPVNDSILSLDLPVKIYFHNDEPKEKLENDYLNYKDSYVSYFKKQGDYVARDPMLEPFFSDTLKNSFIKLNQAIDFFLSKLEKGKIIKVLVKGYSSPLFDSEYNEKLSRRRIKSVVNYMKQYNGGKLLIYFLEDKITIEEVSFGEKLAPLGVSDSEKNKLKSIYSLGAMQQRRVEIVDFKLF